MYRSAACDIGSERLRGPVLGWYAEGVIDESYIDRASFEKQMAVPRDKRREQLRERGRSYIRDPETEIAWWHAYHEKLPGMTQRESHADTTIVRDTPKIGRNDPCPCGSGRKYKKCHGAA